MSKLNELIKTYCPIGVTYRKISNLCSIATGKLNANAMVNNGKYPFLHVRKKLIKLIHILLIARHY